MNNDAFEDRLRELTARLARPDPTPGWKSDILARAAHSRDQVPAPAPRWLLATLGAAWVLIAAMRFTTPHDSTTPPPVTATPVSADSSAHTPWRSLMAFHSNPELLDLP